MKNKKGLTLIELIVSMVLISMAVVFLFQLLIELRYQNLNDTSKVEYKVAATIITQKIQNILIDEKIDLIENCDATNTCIKITFISKNYLEIKITNDNKVLSIMKKDSSNNIILEDVRQIPEKDETGYLGKYDNLAYTTSAFTPTNTSYNYKYDSLFKLEFNMYDSLNNIYPISIYYPYAGGADYSTMYLNNVRYIKDCANGSTVNNASHWVELQAFSNNVNVALNKTVTGTTPYNASFQPYSVITNGDITSANYAQPSVTGQLQCITVDLGQTYNLDKITVWHYYADGRIYYSNTTYVSGDNTTWKPVMANLNSESSLGKSVTKYDLNKTVIPIYRVSNLVTNGSFENSTTGWSTYNYTMVLNSTYKKDGNYSMPVVTTNSTHAQISQSVPIIAGNKYYGKVSVLKTSALDASGQYDILNFTSGEMDFAVSDNTTIPNTLQWYDVSNILSGIETKNADLRKYTFSKTPVYTDSYVLIDLTSTFGAGKEPSKAWCDANLSYFDGSQNLILKP